MSAPNPRLRHQARLRAVQFLYSLELTRYDLDEALPEFWEHHPARPSVRDYAEDLIRGALTNRTELDAEIQANLRNWSFERLGRVERNILRVALYELLNRPDVPRRVVINEAIELAKEMGAEDSPRFINGVLDRLKRDHRQSADNPDATDASDP